MLVIFTGGTLVTLETWLIFDFLCGGTLVTVGTWVKIRVPGVPFLLKGA